MKKINWGFIAMVMFIVVATFFGVMQMEYNWCEEQTAQIWKLGMNSIVVIYIVNKLCSVIDRLNKD